MKYLFNTLVVVLLLALVSGCQQPAPTAQEILESIPLPPGKMVVLEIEAGKVTLVGGAQAALQIEGQLLAPDQVAFSIHTSDEKIEINAPVNKRPFGGFSTPPIDIVVSVPDGFTVLVNTFDASVEARDFQGDLQITSVSGRLLAERVVGSATLISGRGNVTISQSSGQLRILGEHGILTLQDVSGKVSSSTIMGTIRYLGRPTEGDQIHLEVDHGPVDITLAPDSNLDVEIRSNSGELACLTPGIISTGRNCLGTIGAGGASLFVRTVSGKVNLRLSALIP